MPRKGDVGGELKKLLAEQVVEDGASKEAMQKEPEIDRSDWAGLILWPLLTSGRRCPLTAKSRDSANL